MIGKSQPVCYLILVQNLKPYDFVTSEITQVVDNKMVGDTGFEPATSTVCKKHKKTKKRKK